VACEAAALYEGYEFADVARLLYRHVWNEVCDWYLETAKCRLYSESEVDRLQVSSNLLSLLETVMTLLHPLMPFVTEEIWGYLPQVKAGERPASLFDARWPEPWPEMRDPSAEAAMEVFMSVVAGLRSTREELGLSREVVGNVRIAESVRGAGIALLEMPEAFRQLCGCRIVGVMREGEEPPGRFASVDGPGVKAMLDLEGLVDVEREAERLIGKGRKAHAEVVRARAKLSNPGFVAKAPAAVVAEERNRLAVAEAVLREVRRQYVERVGGRLPLPADEHGLPGDENR
jgi:valyl-tRNA synthetase